MSVDNTMVTLDDTDPQLQWNGAWFPTTNFDDVGHMGAPFLNTLHGISTNGSMTFSFYGRSVSVWGTVRPRNSTRGSDPTWQCILDGTVIASPWEYPDASYSNYLYCYGRNLPEANHTLQLNTIIQSQTLYVDSVQYQASPTADIGNAWTEVRQSDGRMKYSPGWITDDDGYRTWTYTTGAWLAFDFNGTGVIWEGYTPGNDAATAGGAQYMIDGEESRGSFAIPSTSDGSPRYSQLYFNVTGLKPGPHRLTVINSGNNGTTALGLAYIYMKNGSAEPESSKGTSAKVIGGAVGGSIGAVLLAVLAILWTIWYRRRKRQREQDAPSMGGTLGKPMSITSNSTDIKEQHTLGSPSLGPWGQPSSVLSHQASVISSNGPHSPSAFVAPSGYQPPTTFATSPSGPSQPTNFAIPPGPNQPTMFVAHTNSTVQRGPSYNATSSVFQPPASFATASSGFQPPSSFTAAPSGMQPPASFVSVPSPGPPQNAWPTPSETPVQHIQDGKPGAAVGYSLYR